MLDLDLLHSFVSVVDAGGFTRAGERAPQPVHRQPADPQVGRGAGVRAVHPRRPPDPADRRRRAAAGLCPPHAGAVHRGARGCQRPPARGRGAPGHPGRFRARSLDRAPGGLRARTADAAPVSALRSQRRADAQPGARRSGCGAAQARARRRNGHGRGPGRVAGAPALDRRQRLAAARCRARAAGGVSARLHLPQPRHPCAGSGGPALAHRL